MIDMAQQGIFWTVISSSPPFLLPPEILLEHKFPDFVDSILAS